MNQARAIALIQYRFPGATETTVDTSSADPGTTVDRDGRVWFDRCGCGRHPHQGHPARPVQRPEQTA